MLEAEEEKLVNPSSSPLVARYYYTIGHVHPGKCLVGQRPTKTSTGHAKIIESYIVYCGVLQYLSRIGKLPSKEAPLHMRVSLF